MIQPAGTINSVANVSYMDSVRSASEASLARDSGPMVLCLLAALVPLVFSVQLFEPYVAAKDILVQSGTATVALLWLLTVRHDTWSLPRTMVWIPLLTLAFIGAISLSWSTNPVISFEKSRYLITYLLLFAVALWAMQRAEARSGLATALVLAGAIEAVYVLIQYLVGDPIFAAAAELPGKWQTFGTLGNPNWTGEFLAVTALITFGSWTDLRGEAPLDPSARPFARHFMLAGLIAMLLALAATLARGAWLAFIVGAFAFVIVRRYNGVPLRWKSFIVPVGATALAAAVIVVMPLLTNREAVGHLLNLKSIRGRLLMWDATLSMIWDAPWFGRGLGTFGLLFPEYQAEVLAQPSWSAFIPNASFTSYPHNDYLQLWAELGIFGLLALGVLIWIVLKRGRTLAADPIALGCWAAVISILVNAAVAFPLHLPATLMLFVVLVAAVEAASSRRSVRARRSIGAIISLTLLVVCSSAFLLSWQLWRTETVLSYADSALERGDLNGAEQGGLSVTAHSPFRIDGWLILARTYFHDKNFPRALDALNEAQRIGFREEIYELKSATLDSSGDNAAAVDTLRELIRLRPDLRWPHQKLSTMEEIR